VLGVYVRHCGHRVTRKEEVSRKVACQNVVQFQIGCLAILKIATFHVLRDTGLTTSPQLLHPFFRCLCGYYDGAFAPRPPSSPHRQVFFFPAAAQSQASCQLAALELRACLQKEELQERERCETCSLSAHGIQKQLRYLAPAETLLGFCNLRSSVG
jgi:hypothetical protein